MYKRSRQREAIIRLLKGTTTHPTAEWVYEQVRKEIRNVSLATVYRNLKLLSESGTILEMSAPSGAAHFDGNTEPHYHFQCDSCGKITDIDEPVDGLIEGRIARKTGLKITHHHLLFGGLCCSCQQVDHARS